jgi:hypothetical protein
VEVEVEVEVEAVRRRRRIGGKESSRHPGDDSSESSIVDRSR